VKTLRLATKNARKGREGTRIGKGGEKDGFNFYRKKKVPAVGCA